MGNRQAALFFVLGALLPLLLFMLLTEGPWPPMTAVRQALEGTMSSRCSSSSSSRSRSSSSTAPAGAILCWHGPSLGHGGQPFGALDRLDLRASSAPLDDENLTITISGSGCRECSVGRNCRFLLHFTNGEAYFGDNKIGPFHDLMASLTGPSLLHADVAELPRSSQSGLTFEASYRPWAAGLYTLTVDRDCNRESWEQFPFRLVSIPVNVTAAAGTAVPGTPATPCEQNLFGHWLPEDPGSGRQSGWRFAPFECAGSAWPASETLMEALTEKGIREISFVGDSNQRVLAQHLQAVISGNFTPAYHEPFEWSHREAAKGLSLRINFYWLDVMYTFGEDGCDVGGRHYQNTSTWPTFSPTSDLVIVNSAAWTIQNCKSRVQAFARHLPLLMDWLATRPRQSRTRIWWRSTPPFPTASHGCERPNSVIQWANGFARTMATQYGWKYIDFWPIEAPRYLDTCYIRHRGAVVKDTHFSCPLHGAMHGEVGEAVVRTLVQMMLTSSLT